MQENFVIWPVVALAVLVLIVVVVVVGIVIALSSTSRRDESKSGSSANVGLVITLLLVAIFGLLVCGGLLAFMFARATDRVQPGQLPPDTTDSITVDQMRTGTPGSVRIDLDTEPMIPEPGP